MADIFLSYARTDREKVETLVAALERSGQSVWWDRHIVGGAEFSKDIERELEEAKHVLVIWSEASKGSPWVKDEATAALGQNKLVPIDLDGVEAPIGFRQYQAIDFSSWDQSEGSEPFQNLLTALSLAPVPKVSQPAKVPPTRWVLLRTMASSPIVLVAMLVFAAFLAIMIFSIRSVENSMSGQDTEATTRPPLSSQVTLQDSQSQQSIAVIPFANLSGDPANAPFADGIHDDLLTAISRIGSIRTVSRTTILQYRDTELSVPEIGKALGVATVLEGGIQRDGQRLRVNVQLIDTANDEHLWAETFDRDLSVQNIFAIQSEIATAVSNALRVTLSQDDQMRLKGTPTQSLAALDAYFKGKQYLWQRHLDALNAAIPLFEYAIALDPDFALAYTGLADANYLLPEYSPTIDRNMTRATSWVAARKALELDPDLPEALRSVGWGTLIQSYNWAEAERFLARALTLHPKYIDALHWQSHILSWQGRHGEAIALARQAVAVDPGSPLMITNLGYILMDAREFEASIEIHSQSELDYPDYDGGLRNLWMANFRAGNYQDGYEKLINWARKTDRNVAAAEQIGQQIIKYRTLGETPEIDFDMFNSVPFGTQSEAQILALLGDREATLDALERAWAERSGSRSVLSMKINPLYDFIRNEPRFKKLLEKTGLADPR